MQLTAESKVRQLLIRDLRLVPRGLEKAAARAINKSLTSTRAEMVRQVRGDYAIKAKSVRDALAIHRASWSRLTGQIRGDGSPGIPLKEFANTKKVPSTKRLKSGGYRPKAGIPVTIRKDKGKIAAKGVFLAKMKSGHVGAFIRPEAGSRYIKEVYGPSAIKLLGSDRYDEAITDYGQEQLDKNLRHEAKRILEKAGLQ